MPLYLFMCFLAVLHAEPFSKVHLTVFAAFSHLPFVPVLKCFMTSRTLDSFTLFFESPTCFDDLLTTS